MNHRVLFVTLCFLLGLLVLPVSAQEEPDFPLKFPLPIPTEAQIEEARTCDLEAKPSTIAGKETACHLAQQALASAKLRLTPTIRPTEIPLVYKILELNPALLLRLSMMGNYFNIGSLVALPDFATIPITRFELTYTFSGLGGSADYEITISNADKKPAVEGHVNFNFSYGADPSAPTPAPQILPKEVDAELVQAFGMALDDFLPIQEQFSSVPCWDYYPDWTIKLTFADKTTLKLVTKDSNAIGIGGPWQTEIDGQNYMQYSASIVNALNDLFEALNIKFGETAAMGCGSVNELLDDAYPSVETN